MQVPKYTAVVADDHKLLRAGIMQILSSLSEIEIVAEATDGLATIVAAKKYKPDLLTLDIAMPHAQGISVVTEVQRWSPGTRIVIFTGITSANLLNEMVHAGVHGIFTKRGDITEFEEAIPTILRGGTVLSSDARAITVNADIELTLTKRERQILSQICAGHSTKQIAETFSISVKTVENHRASLMAKLNVRSLAELLAYAVREGLLNPQRHL
jgi:DNA-binding NarL/FixJ family response regulator